MAAQGILGLRQFEQVECASSSRDADPDAAAAPLLDPAAAPDEPEAISAQLTRRQPMTSKRRSRRSPRCLPPSAWRLP